MAEKQQQHSAELLLASKESSSKTSNLKNKQKKSKQLKQQQQEQSTLPALPPIKNRVIPPQIIDQYQKRVTSLEKSIVEVMAMEKEEKQLCEAERETLRAQNLLQHESEILSRPARTWFQTEKEKKESKVKGQEKYEKDMGLVNKKALLKERRQAAKQKIRDVKLDEMPRKQRRKILFLREQEDLKNGIIRPKPEKTKEQRRQMAKEATAKLEQKAKRLKASIARDKKTMHRSSSSTAKSKHAFKSKKRYQRK